MKEVITVNIGQCGIKLGSKFWEILIEEHGLNNIGVFKGDSDIQLNKIGVFFRETSHGFFPRSVMVDLDPSTSDFIRNLDIGGMFNKDNFICSTSSSGNNFAKGYYTDGPDVLDGIMEILRKESEPCDSIETFQLFCGLGGGTGSGITALLCNKLKEEFPDRVQAIISHSDAVTESYNAVLCVDQIMATTNFVNLLDNDALGLLCLRELKIQHPSMGDLNHLISMVASGISTNVRFPGKLSTDFRKLSTNLIPYPRFVFLCSTFAPMINRAASEVNYNTNLHLISRAILDPLNLMISIDPRRGKYIAVTAAFRGLNYPLHEIENEMFNYQNKNSHFFIDWVPNHIKISACDIPPRGLNLSATFIGNNTSILENFDKLAQQFSYMFRRRAFLHFYISEGMEEDEFRVAEENILDLIDDYQRITNYSVIHD